MRTSILVLVLLAACVGTTLAALGQGPDGWVPGISGGGHGSPYSSISYPAPSEVSQPQFLERETHYFDSHVIDQDGDFEVKPCVSLMCAYFKDTNEEARRQEIYNAACDLDKAEAYLNCLQDEYSCSKCVPEYMAAIGRSNRVDVFGQDTIHAEPAEWKAPGFATREAYHEYRAERTEAVIRAANDGELPAHFAANRALLVDEISSETQLDIDNGFAEVQAARDYTLNVDQGLWHQFVTTDYRRQVFNLEAHFRPCRTATTACVMGVALNDKVMLDDIKFVQLEPCNAGVGTSCRQTFRVETETCGIQNLFVAFFCSGDSDVEVKAEPPLLRPSIHFTLEAVDTTRPCGMPTPDDDIATGGDGDAL